MQSYKADCPAPCSLYTPPGLHRQVKPGHSASGRPKACSSAATGGAARQGAYAGHAVAQRFRLRSNQHSMQSSPMQLYRQGCIGR